MISSAMMLIGCVAVGNENSKGTNNGKSLVSDENFTNIKATSLDLKPGHPVLAIHKDRIPELMSKKIEEVEFVNYFPATIVSVGPEKTIVKSSYDGEYEVPNFLIIPLAIEEKVKNGDILLATLPHTSGIRKAIVVDDSNPIQPKVHFFTEYMEASETNFESTIVELTSNSYRKISNKWDIGSNVALYGMYGYESHIVVHVTDKKVITQRSYNTILVYDKDKVIPLEPTIKLQKGKTYFASTGLEFNESEVIEDFPKYGRALMKNLVTGYQFYAPYGEFIENLK